MNLELFALNGYGQFVWPAFVFTFASCFILYIKTKKEFKKQEKTFLIEFKQKELQERKAIREEKKAFSVSPIF